VKESQPVCPVLVSADVWRGGGRSYSYTNIDHNNSLLIPSTKCSLFNPSLSQFWLHFLVRDAIYTSRAYATMLVFIYLWWKCIGAI